MTVNQAKISAIAIMAVLVFAALAFKPANVAAVSRAEDDTAAVYKAKCLMCHTAKATKFFDPAKPEEEMVQAILKGMKAEKPPNMPAFADKGITEDGAKALVTYMKGLRAGS